MHATWPRTALVLLPAIAVTALAASAALQVAPGAQTWGGGLWTVAVPLLLSTYPDGRFVPAWLLVPVLGYLALAIAYIATDAAIGDTWWWTAAALAQVLFLLPAVHRYRRRLDTGERERVRWGILGFLVGTEGMLALVVIGTVSGGTINDLGPGASALATAFTLLIPAGFGVGLIRPRLVNVDLLLRDVLRISLTATVLAVSFAVVLWAGTAAGLPAVEWWAGGVVAVLAVPVFRAATRLADGVVYRNRPDPARAIAALGARLSADSLSSEVTRTLAELAIESLALAGARVEGAGLPTSQIGAVADSAEEFAIVHRAERIGVLTVAPRTGESALTRRDREVLEALVLHAAPALLGARTMGELVDARSRVVRAREAERKQLRRDLHDDLAPTLSGLGLSAAGIAELARESDPRILAVTEGLLRDIRDAIGQTRQIAYGLRPAVLDDHGLVAAIRDRTQHPSGELVVEVAAADERLDLPAAVELTALRIVQEAVLNVRKHAGASLCRIEVAISGNRLALSISDDGSGIPGDVAPGIGLRSIRERASELGGTASITRRAEGGTLVRVLIPAVSGAS